MIHSSGGNSLSVCVPSKDLMRYGIAGSPARSGIQRRRKHAGQDIAPETQDIGAFPLLNAHRSQMAVRNATAQPGTYPLIIFSHSSGGNRLQLTFLCTHLSSHGYLVAALDHSEIVAAELTRKDGETDKQKTARVEAWVANRAPDIRFLLDHLLNDTAWDSEARPDPTRIGIVGHSFGGWTALAATEVERRIGAVVALAPGGSSQPKPGIIPGKLTFNWGRNVPTLYLVAENDVFLPLAGMYELFEKDSGDKTDDHPAPSRSYALHGQCRGNARGRSENAVHR